jgi:5-methylcytosine-specific restriction endonuclease McrA
LTKACARCGGEFVVVRPAQYERSKYCGVACQRASRPRGEQAGNWNGGLVTMPCGTCGCPVRVFRCRANRQRYCSKPCAAEGRTIAGSGSQLSAPNTRTRRRAANRKDYKEWRRAVLAHDEMRCRRCGATAVRLVAHHVIPWILEPALRYDVNNGETLCLPCHWKEPHTDVWRERTKQSVRPVARPVESPRQSVD